jgi:undecaprenyl-diphosphatase
MSIPIILASGGLLLVEIPSTQAPVDWQMLLLAFTISALVAFATIHFFLKLLPSIGVLPFVIYRLIFGAVLLLWLI